MTPTEIVNRRDDAIRCRAWRDTAGAYWDLELYYLQGAGWVIGLWHIPDTGGANDIMQVSTEPIGLIPRGQAVAIFEQTDPLAFRLMVQL